MWSSFNLIEEDIRCDMRQGNPAQTDGGVCVEETFCNRFDTVMLQLYDAIVHFR